MWVAQLEVLVADLIRATHVVVGEGDRIQVHLARHVLVPVEALACGFLEGLWPRSYNVFIRSERRRNIAGAIALAELDPAAHDERCSPDDVLGTDHGRVSTTDRSSAADITSSCFNSAAIAAFNAGLSRLPTRVSGNDSMTSMRSGHLNLASPLATRKSASSLTAGAR